MKSQISMFPEYTFSETKVFQNIEDARYTNRDLAKYLSGELMFKIGPVQICHVLEHIEIYNSDNLPTENILHEYYTIKSIYIPEADKYVESTRWTEAGMRFILNKLRKYSKEELAGYFKKYSCFGYFPVKEL